MVHLSHEVNKESKIVVTALFYKIGKPNRFLSKVKKMNTFHNHYKLRLAFVICYL